MANSANEDDLAAFLDQQAKDVADRITKARSAVIAKAAKMGAVNSSGRIIQSMQSDEASLHEWIVELITLSANWNGPNLPDHLVRQRHCETFRQAVATHVGSPQGRMANSSFDNMAGEIRNRLTCTRNLGPF